MISPGQPADHSAMMVTVINDNGDGICSSLFESVHSVIGVIMSFFTHLSHSFDSQAPNEVEKLSKLLQKGKVLSNLLKAIS
jgi:hypothetical protein